MPDFIFVTSNDSKAVVARLICDQFGVSFDRENLDLVEIQSDNGEEIATHKARQAFEATHKPVVITDDTWIIPGLNGFPGPYMKQMNGWLTPEDFLHLTAPLKNRHIILRQIIAYKDESTEKLFSVDTKGVLLKEIRGDSKYRHFTITLFDGGHRSLAETETSDSSAHTKQHGTWHELCTWLQAKN